MMTSGDKTVDRVLERRDAARAAEKERLERNAKDLGERPDPEAQKREVEEGAESGKAAEQGRNPPSE